MLLVNRIFSLAFFIALLQVGGNADIGNIKWLNYGVSTSEKSNPNSPFYCPQKSPDLFQYGKDTISPPPTKIEPEKSDNFQKEYQKQKKEDEYTQQKISQEIAENQKGFLGLIVGKWKINTGGIVGSRDEKQFFYSGTLTIKKDGKNLSGTIDFGLGKENLKEISFDGKNIIFVRETLVSVQNYRGIVNGNKITGTFVHEDSTQKATQYWEAEKY